LFRNQTKNTNEETKNNKSSEVAEMGDRGHNRHGPGGVLCPFRRALGTRLIQCGLRGGLYFEVPSVLRHCQLGDTKVILLVKKRPVLVMICAIFHG